MCWRALINSECGNSFLRTWIGGVSFTRYEYQNRRNLDRTRRLY